MIKALSLAAALAFATPALAGMVPQATPASADARSPEAVAFEAREGLPDQMRAGARTLIANQAAAN